MWPESDAYSPLPPTPRHRAADAIAENIVRIRLWADGNVIDAVRHGSGKYYTVHFGILDRLQGEARVYSTNYFLVFWKTNIPNLPSQDRRLFASVEETVAFLELAFVAKDWAAASQVPVYQHKLAKKPVVEEAGQKFPNVDDDFFCADRDTGSTILE